VRCLAACPGSSPRRAYRRASRTGGQSRAGDRSPLPRLACKRIEVQYLDRVLHQSKTIRVRRIARGRAKPQNDRAQSDPKTLFTSAPLSRSMLLIISGPILR